MSVKQRTWQTLSEPKFGKPVKITVWRNGDFNYPGQEITLHSKYLRSWNSILEYLTVVLQPRWGGVKRLYHLDTQKPVLCVQEIKPNEKYVAVGGDKLKYKKNGYLTVRDQKTKVKDDQSDDPISTFMAYTKQKKRTVVYFMVSGRDCQPALKVVLIERDLLDYHMILDYLSYRLDVGEGIQYLCSTTGKQIKNPTELCHGGIYVAVPYGSEFIKLDYTEIFHALAPAKITEKKKIKPRKNEPKGGTHKPINQEDSEEVKKEDNFSNFGDESSEVNVVCASQKKIIPTEKAPLQVFGHAFSQKELSAKNKETINEPSKKIDEDDSAQGVLHVKCIGTKCFNKNCRLMRKEYDSVSGVINEPAKEKSAVEEESDYDEVHETNTENGQDVESTSVPEDSLLEFEKKTTPSEKNEIHLFSPSEESVTTITAVQTNMHNNNLITFADIAKNRKNNEQEMDTNLLQPIMEEENMPHRETGRTSNQSSTSTTSKKKEVSFLQCNKPEVIEDVIETNLRRIGSTGFLSSLDSKKPPKVSILKNTTPVDNPRTESIPVTIHSSFLSVRSSISDKKSQSVQRKLSKLIQEGVDIISNEELDVSYLDLPTEEDDEPEEKSSNKGNGEQPEEDVKKDDSVEMYEKTDDTSEYNENDTDNESVGSENGNSKAVQKGWMLNEDAFDKSIQAEDSKNGGSSLVSSCTQTDECC